MDYEKLLRDHEKLLRDFMDSKCKSRDYKNTKLCTDHIHVYTCIYMQYRQGR